MNRLLTGEDLKLIQLFEALTGVEVMDFYEVNNVLTFIVKEGKIGLALGRNKKNVFRLRELYKKNIRIIEDSSDIERFLKNLIYPVKPLSIEVKDSQIVLRLNRIDKARIIGREKKNLKALQSALSKKGISKELRIE